MYATARDYLQLERFPESKLQYMPVSIKEKYKAVQPLKLNYLLKTKIKN